MVLYLLLAAVTPDTLNNAIKEMNAAQAAAEQCDSLVQIKAARMQLELLREVKDYLGAETMGPQIAEITNCAPAAKNLANAVAILGGATIDNDHELEAEPLKPKEAKPAESKPVTKDLTSEMEGVAKMLGTGWKLISDPKSGYGNAGTWVEKLEAGKCYAMVGVAPTQAKRIALYLFDPEGKKRAWRKGKNATVIMYLCPFAGGEYAIQAKVKVKHADKQFAVGTYVRE